LQGHAGGQKGSSLERRISKLAWACLAVQAAFIVVVGASGFRVAVGQVRAIQARDTEVAAANLLAGMADEQTGLLTYLKPAQPDSLLLYSHGRDETRAALDALHRGTSGTAEAALDARVGAAVAAWQRWADHLRARSVAASLPVTDPAEIAEGKRLFGDFSAAQRDLASRLDVLSRYAAVAIQVSTEVAVVVTVGGSMSVAVVLALFAMRIVRKVLNPLRDLAEASGQVAIEGRALIPDVGRQDEVGELARALQGWQDASAVQAIVAEEAPVGICRLDAEGHFVVANAEYETMLGYPREELAGRPFWTFLHPDDMRKAKEGHQGVIAGTVGHYETENRWLRKDGSVVWFSMVATPVLGADGHPETLIGIMEDITDRKRQLERAARIQRELLPTERPDLDGYELAAACLPAQDVGGDFYDWISEAGHLDVTVADVMGKGVGSALVMATLRTAQRTARSELGPAARVGLMAESLSRGLTNDGLFVTMFHARLDLGSGVLRYVDAGHGYCVVRRADGGMERLERGSVPLGVIDGCEYTEGEVRLKPGESLLVYTDGLVEVGDVTTGLSELAGDLKPSMGAEEMVSRLVDRVRDQQTDDVTVVVLRRLAEPRARDQDAA
jgi:PAS domain S-box-containing protein